MTAETGDEVSFVDAGENFDAVYCPLCQAELDQEWWGEAMGTAGEEGFSDLAVDVPCCGGRTSLNDLRYEMSQGFARFVLQAVDLNVEVLSDEVLGELTTTLGCELRVVRTRY